MDVKPGLMLREQHRPRVFENGELKGIFETKGDEVTKDWRKKHNKKLYHFSIHQIVFGWPNQIELCYPFEKYNYCTFHTKINFAPQREIT
jgi:hypothetical protein